MGLFNKILGNIKLKILNSYFGYTVSSAPFDGEFWIMTWQGQRLMR